MYFAGRLHPTYIKTPNVRVKKKLLPFAYMRSRTVKYKPKQKNTDEHEDCSDSDTSSLTQYSCLDTDYEDVTASLLNSFK